jgi:tRNA A37 threonylcarbamoyladenosine dehydratase
MDKETENWQSRSELLLGSDTIKAFKAKKVAVVGLGGVGSFAAEMIARSGVGNMLLLDSDKVSITNKNRQLIALDSTVGIYKCDVLATRLRDINPEIHLSVAKEFLSEDNVERLLSPFGADYIVDAIDTLSPKISLIKYAIANSIPVVSSMGAGAKFDGTRLQITDISKSYNCPLAYMLRKRLGREGIRKGFKVVFSSELPDSNAILPVQEQNKKSVVGTVPYLPAMFGALCAQEVICHFAGHKY